MDIKNSYDNSVIYSSTKDTIREAVLEYIEQERKAGRVPNLQYADLQSADLQYANLQYANLQSANLQSANLQYANLQSADLRSANLQSADLQSADLQSANLQYANLQSAMNFNPYQICSLYSLKQQKGVLFAYKMVDKELRSPIQSFNKITYKIGEYFECQGDVSEAETCSFGLNVANMQWICNNWSKGNRLIEVQFTANDIAAIPYTSDGKYRVHRLYVTRELDPKTFGLE